MRKFFCTILVVIIVLSSCVLFVSCTTDRGLQGEQSSSRPLNSARTQAQNLVREQLDFGTFDDVVKPYGRVLCNYKVYKYSGGNGKPLYMIDAAVTVIPGIVEVSQNEKGFARYKIDSGCFDISVGNINIIVVDMYPINSYGEFFDGQTPNPMPVYTVQQQWNNLQCVYWMYDYYFAVDNNCDIRLEYWFKLTDDNVDSMEFKLNFNYKVVVKRGFLTKNFTGNQQFDCKL